MAGIVLGAGIRLMHWYEGVGFPLKLAETVQVQLIVFLV